MFASSSRCTTIAATFLSIPEMIVLGAIVAVAAALGDLFESAFKRDLEVKDCGRLLAGHGGVLDRVDAFLFALPRRVLHRGGPHSRLTSVNDETRSPSSARPARSAARRSR